MLIKRKNSEERLSLLAKSKVRRIKRDVLSITLSLLDIQDMVRMSPTKLMTRMQAMEAHFVDPLKGKL